MPMSEGYYPPSVFLNSVIAEEVSIELDGFGAENLKRLIEMTSDPDLANRDWATLLLALLEFDTPSIRNALLQAAEDSSGIVRAEAICGIAQREPAVELDLILRELAGDELWYPILDAIEAIPNQKFIPLLEQWDDKLSDKHFNEAIESALQACRDSI
jgi:HEAT repeat protein